MISESDLQAIQKRADAATKGPWTHIPGDSWCAFPHVSLAGKTLIFEDHQGHEPGECGKTCEDGFPPDEADAEFIARSRTDVPLLVAEIRRLKAIAQAVVDTQEEDEKEIALGAITE